MATYNFTRISNVVRLSVDGGTPRLFSNVWVSAMLQPDNTNILIQLGDSSAPLTVKYTDLRFGASNQSSASAANAISLLNSIFAS